MIPELKHKLKPFVLIDTTDVNHINSEAQKAIVNQSKPLLLLKEMPESSHLDTWVNSGMLFLIKNNTLTEPQENTIATKAKGNAIFFDYTNNQVRSFLQNGNSVLIHQGNADMTAEKIKSVCAMAKPEGAKDLYSTPPCGSIYSTLSSRTLQKRISANATLILASSSRYISKQTHLYSS